MYQAGRLSEARLIAAQGVAAGAYPRNETLDWLSSRDQAVTRVRRWLRDQDEQRLPPLYTADELLSLWDMGVDATEETRLGLLRAQQLRSNLDTDLQLGSFQRTLLFSTDGGWEQAMAQAEIEVLPGGHSGATAVVEDYLLVDGAYKHSLACVAALELVSDDAPAEFTAQWPLPWSQGRPLLPGSFGWLWKFGTPVTLVRELTAPPSADEVTMRGKSGRPLLEDLLAEVLVLLATAPTPFFPARVTREEEILASLQTTSPGVLARSFNLGMAWSVTLWRLAPTDARSLQRYGQAVELALRYVELSGSTP